MAETEEEEERRKKKRKGRIKDGGKAEGRWQVCNKLRKGQKKEIREKVKIYNF